MCMVTPRDRRSLTRRTLLITSRPRSSKTRTFQIGSPSAFRMGDEGPRAPVARGSSPSPCSSALLRLRIFFKDAEAVVQHLLSIVREGEEY